MADPGAAPSRLAIRGRHRFDVVVVGAGIVGVTLAALLAERGARVALLEQGRVGSGVTGVTTGKVTVLHGARYHQLARRHGLDAAGAYAAAQLAGLDLLRQRAQAAGEVTTWEERPALTWTAAPDRVDDLAAEAEVARQVGIDAELVDGGTWPVASLAGVRVAGQAQFDPVGYLTATADAVEAAGGQVFEGSRVVHLDLAGSSVRTDDATIDAGHVVLACGIPFADRGGYSMRLEPQRSYALALEVSGTPPEDMAISLDAPTRSVRTAPDGAGGRLVLVGGEGHVTGREPDSWGPYERLLDWARRSFADGAAGEVRGVRGRWSAQDYESIDLLPYVGPLWPVSDRCLVATGFAKWGMTNGAAAALALADHIDGRPRAWAGWFDPARRSQLGSIGKAASLGGHVACRFVGDRWATRHQEQPRCPHMGGVMAWNPAERSWDCPLHGSRFTATGELLQGPATTDLEVPLGAHVEAVAVPDPALPHLPTPLWAAPDR
jgi:glycine/D-amino acid oxidase-like deaminating enzyme